MSTTAASQKPVATTAGAKPGAAAAPGVRKLKKGELLFTEGENSRAMYFLKSGVIRLFKKKGDSVIELDTVRSGQVLGELAFLDGNPRSASGEALTDCELTEVSGPQFQSVLTQMPEWLKILLKTVVGRLRTASTRIRQLESASTAFDYSDKDGKRAAHYIFLAPTDALKIMSGVLLIGARVASTGSPPAQGLMVRSAILTRYVNQIMGVPAAKITTMLDVLAQCGIVVVDEATGDAILKDMEFLEKAIAFLNEQNMAEPSKRKDISIRGFLIMSLICKHLGKYQPDPTGVATVNIAEVKKLETPAGGKEPFRMDEAGELVKVGYMGSMNVKSSDEVLVTLKPDEFSLTYRFQRVNMALNAANEQKRKAGGIGKA